VDEAKIWVERGVGKTVAVGIVVSNNATWVSTWFGLGVVRSGKLQAERINMVSNMIDMLFFMVKSFILKVWRGIMRFINRMAF